jgi:hypothetical protein
LPAVGSVGEWRVAKVESMPPRVARAVRINIEAIERECQVKLLVAL